MIERFEIGKRYRWTHSEPGDIWSSNMEEGLIGGRVALCTRCDGPGDSSHYIAFNSSQYVEFDTVPGGCWWYLISENKYFEEVVEEYL